MKPTAPNYDNENKNRFFRYAVTTLAATLLFLGCFAIISPFLPAMVLGILLTLATWPAFTYITARTGNRTTIAALIMTVMLAVLFVVPLVLLGDTLVESFRSLLSVVTNTLGQRHPGSPEWMEEVPIVGNYLGNLWDEYTADREKLLLLVQEHAGAITNWLLKAGGVLGRGIIDISLAVVFSFFMFQNGYTVSTRLIALSERFIGPRGEDLLRLTKSTLISVIYGVLGTAVIQGIIAAVGFLIAGVPGAALLGLVTFLSAVIPVGPPLIWGGATIWLVMQDQIGWAIFMGLWGAIAVSSLDNVFRVYFISLGAKLPLLLIILGVFGGLMAFGFIGLFVGPTLLAIAYNLVIEWSVQQTKRLTDGTHDVIYARDQSGGGKPKPPAKPKTPRK